VFGPTHVGALIAGGVIGAGIILAGRGYPASRLVKAMERGFAVMLFITPFVPVWTQWRAGAFDLQSVLPAQYCDLAAFAGAAALWTHRHVFCEIVYFFGLSGTLQGLLTPALTRDYPSFSYFHFFTAHVAVVTASLYVVLALRHEPRPGAVGRAMIVMSCYAAAVGLLNAALGTNYGFLCAKSPNPSLLDFMGPWPWYLVPLWFAGLLFYSALYLPFWLARRRVEA
jgi:hypothetical integral membrane protein (TIGR02206 family)